MSMDNVKKYLNQLSQKLQNSLGSNLVGIYQTGSLSLDNYMEDKSDLDVIVVINKPITKKARNTLSQELDHKNFPCPAKGLELIIFTKETLANINSEPRYEFWFGTGSDWIPENWAEGKTKEMVIFIELCRQNGRILFGKNTDDVFPSVKREWLIEAFLGELYWHQTKILDPFHDPLGMNSVLNACRILAFVKEGEMISKSAGGEWFLNYEPNNDLVKGALAIRNQNIDVELQKEDIDLFLKKMIRETENPK
jgi:predicted nucleotidyltransferase